MTIRFTIHCKEFSFYKSLFGIFCWEFVIDLQQEQIYRSKDNLISFIFFLSNTKYRRSINGLDKHEHPK